MNIKRKTGKMVCIQKNGHRTLCGQIMENYVETDEECACKKCLHLKMYNGIIQGLNEAIEYEKNRK